MFSVNLLCLPEVVSSRTCITVSTMRDSSCSLSSGSASVAPASEYSEDRLYFLWRSACTCSGLKAISISALSLKRKRIQQTSFHYSTSCFLSNYIARLGSKDYAAGVLGTYLYLLKYVVSMANTCTPASPRALLTSSSILRPFPAATAFARCS